VEQEMAGLLDLGQRSSPTSDVVRGYHRSKYSPVMPRPKLPGLLIADLAHRRRIRQRLSLSLRGLFDPTVVNSRHQHRLECSASP
jgi:hypothetical protein